MFRTDRVVLIIPVPYMRSATRWTCPTLRNVGYCPIVTRDASREDISGIVRSTDWTVPGWSALAFASSSAAWKPRKAAGEAGRGEVARQRQARGHAAAGVQQLGGPELGFGLQDVGLGGDDRTD